MAVLLLGKKAASWRWFIPLMLLTVIAESAGWYLSFFLKKTNNHWIFNILLFLSVIFYLWIFSGSAALLKAKKQVYTMIGLFILFAIINTLFGEGPAKYNSLTEMAGDIMMALMSCYFFYETIK